MTDHEKIKENMESNRLLLNALKHLIPELPARIVDLQLKMTLEKPPELNVTFYAEPSGEEIGDKQTQTFDLGLRDD